jgi:hypothetical protein
MKSLAGRLGVLVAIIGYALAVAAAAPMRLQQEKNPLKQDEGCLAADVYLFAITTADGDLAVDCLVRKPLCNTSSIVFGAENFCRCGDPDRKGDSLHRFCHGTWDEKAPSTGGKVGNFMIVASVRCIHNCLNERKDQCSIEQSGTGSCCKCVPKTGGSG